MKNKEANMNITEIIKEEVIKRDKEDQKTREYSFYEEHIKYVVKNAKELAKKYKADIEIVELAALLHDIAIISKVGDREEHHINGSIIAEELLTKYNYPKDKIERVKQCILKHRGSVTIPRNTIEEEIIADADAISHFDNITLLYLTAIKRKGKNIKEASLWVEKKLAKDYNKLSERTKLDLKDRYENIVNILFNK